MFQGNLMQCSSATVNRVKTCFLKETGVMNRETVSRVVVILFSDLMTLPMLGRSPLDRNKDHLLNEARSELMRQEHQVGSLNKSINELQQQALCSKIGIGGRPSRIH